MAGSSSESTVHDNHSEEHEQQQQQSTTSEFPTTRRPQPPHIIIPPHDEHTPDSSGGHNSGQHSNPGGVHGPSGEDAAGPSITGLANLAGAGNGKPARRVQWPAELSHHHSVHMRSPTSPQTLQDAGAQDALRRALEAHSQKGDEDHHPRTKFTSASEPPSRGESSDGAASDLEEERQEMRDQMEVYVDPGETDGLPAVGRAAVNPQAKSAKQAWSLVRAYTSGTQGFMRHRKNGGFKSGNGDGANAGGRGDAPGDPEKNKDEESRAGEDGDDEEERKGGAGNFFKNLLRSDGLTDIPDRAPTYSSSGSGNSASLSGAGVLSALMALQAQQNDLPSGTTSAATSPSNSRAPSIAGSDDDDTDDEAERIKFIEKQRAKRAGKNSFHYASGAVADAGKSFAHSASKTAQGTAGAVLGFATGHHRRGHSDATTTPGSPPSAGDAGHVPSATSASSGKTSPFGMLKGASRSSSHLPQEPPSPGLHNPTKKKGLLGETAHQLGRIGKAVGLDTETPNSRPEMAKSSAGVFGGLVMSTGNIASVASPAATTLAPDSSRPGYHLSRYSAPTVKPQVEGRKSFDMSWARSSSRPSSRPGSRPQSLYEVDLDSSSKGETPLNSPQLKSGGNNTPPSAASLKSSKPTFSISLPHGPKLPFHSRPPSGENTPRRESHLGDYFLGVGHSKEKETPEEREKREWEKEKRRRRKAREKRKAEQVFITQHVAAILARQDFLLKMGRAFMMFGAPSHRLEAQMQATAKVLEINCQVVYIPGVMLVSFGDVATHTSEIKFLKQANGLDLGKLLAAYFVYYNVVHDKVSVTDASVELDDLMKAPPKYKLWQHLLIGGFASAVIQPSAFYGSFIDALVAIPLGSLLVLTQVFVSRNDLYSSLFEIVIACINSFLAAALASTNQFCFAAVASGSVVLILPGYIVLCGSLELANRSIISGSVRLVYSILYSLFLGFGLGMGAEVYQRITGLSIAGASDYTCSALRTDAPWYRAAVPQKYYILTIPLFLLMLALRNGQPLFRKETIVMLIIGASGFTANFFGGKAFPNRSDISSALGSFTVGFLGNIYGKFSKATSPFVVMVIGVLVQLPSGLSNGGLLTFASSDDSSVSYSAGFTTAQSLVEVAIGLTVGLFIAAAIVNFFGGGRRRGSNLSSF
ncbi:DUF1212-domain-containing protein [Meredithblackwellia eburnea MCA 4105]